jgi:transposase
VEVNRPNRQARRRCGKSEPVDVEASAQAALPASHDAQDADGTVEILLVLRVARRSASKVRGQAATSSTSCW